VNSLADFKDFSDVIKQTALGAVNAIKPTAVFFGQVISTDPLKINVEQKITLERPQLVLARNVTDYTVEITVDHSTASAWVPLTTSETAHMHSVPAHQADSANPSITHTHNISATQTAEGGEEEPHTHSVPAAQTEPASPDTTHIHNIAAQSTAIGGFSTAVTQAGQHIHGYAGRKKFLVHNGLAVGDEVILVQVQGGQKFLVLDRLG
jgi:hypothetical protein